MKQIWGVGTPGGNQAEITEIRGDDGDYVLTVHDIYESADIKMTLRELEEMYEALGEALGK